MHAFISVFKKFQIFSIGVNNNDRESNYKKYSKNQLSG